MTDPDMTGRNGIPVVVPELVCIKKEMRKERDRLFDLELRTGYEPELFYLQWLESERSRGVEFVLVNF